MHGLHFIFALGVAALPGSSSSSCNNTLTVTKDVSYTPAPVTVTKTVTSVETDTLTDYRSTETTTSTYLDSVYVTRGFATVTTTTTSYRTVSTIPAPGSFIPIRSSLPDSSYRNLKFLNKRDVAFLEGNSGEIARPVPRAIISPESSYCATKTSTVTTRFPETTVTSTTTYSDFTVVTFTTSGTTTSTALVSNPTSTVTITSRHTRTVTKTARGSSTSFYAACATNYFANEVTYEGFKFGFVAPYETTGKQDLGDNADPSSYSDYKVPNAYECCVASLTNSSKLSSSWYYWYNPETTPQGIFGDNTTCRVYLQPQDTCSVTGQNTTNWDFPIFVGFEPSRGIVVGNGYCGKYTEVFVLP